jgi:hypothetical protein
LSLSRGFSKKKTKPLTPDAAPARPVKALTHHRATRAMAIIACCLGSFAVGCAKYGAEQLLLERFFFNSRLRDRTALQQISTVIFEPREQGTVNGFSIVSAIELEAAGAVRLKQVTVRAPVRLPDGRTESRTIVFALQHRDRWIVTGFTVSQR